MIAIAVTDAERGPNASRRVTLGSVCASLGYRSTAGDQAIQHDDDGDDEQQVNQPTTDIERKGAQEPQHEENYGKSPDHREPP